MPPMFALKLAYGDDIRKIFVEKLTISWLHDQIRNSFPDLNNVSFADLFVYYIDNEDDKVRIKLDLELAEALRIQSADRTLKIFVQKLETSTPSPAPISSPPTSDITISQLAPFLGMMNNVAPMLLNNPMVMQQMASMIPTMLPLLSSIFNPVSPVSPVNPTNPQNADSTPITANYSVPFAPIVSPVFTTAECGLSATPSCSSVSTNTLVDAKDVATETALYGVTQTTQTQQQNPNTHQTTQTHHHTSSATQTAQGACATQTTQTGQNATCATQTAQESLASQTTQTAQEPLASQTTQTLETLENPELRFYESLAGTRFGGFLEQLRELGFTDKDKCVQALVKNGGKLPEAIDELLLDQLLE